jgi:hypothetical protein
MRQARHRLGLAQQARLELRGGRVRVQQLERDAAIEDGIARCVDAAHAPAPTGSRIS